MILLFMVDQSIANVMFVKWNIINLKEESPRIQFVKEVTIKML